MSKKSEFYKPGDITVGSEHWCGMRRAVEGHRDVALCRRRWGVSAYHNVTKSYHLIYHNVRVERITTPLGAFASQKFGFRVLTTDEALEDARAVRETRPSSADDRAVEPETHGTSTHTRHSAWVRNNFVYNFCCLGVALLCNLSLKLILSFIIIIIIM